MLAAQLPAGKLFTQLPQAQDLVGGAAASQDTQSPRGPGAEPTGLGG